MKIKQGYFEKNFSVYSIQSIWKLFPEIPQTQLVKNNLGISYHTYLKIKRTGTTDGLRLSTIKKISKAINNSFTAKNQILIGSLAVHLKRYKNVSDKKLKKIKKDVNRISGLKLTTITDKEYIIFRFIYGRL